MSSFAQAFEKLFRRFLPSPLALALLLSLFSFGLVAFWGGFPEANFWPSAIQSWYQGLWNSQLLVFMVQMMLILVLGHALALAAPVDRFIQFLLGGVRKAPQATALVAFSSLLVASLNWGLGLIFGAILARKTAEKLQALNQNYNYGLLGAAGYSGLMIWHGGLSGSAPLKAAESGHLAQLAPSISAQLPDRLTLSETIFSSMNLWASALLLLSVPLLLALLARGQKSTAAPLLVQAKLNKEAEEMPHDIQGAEYLDQKALPSRIIGTLLLLVALFIAIWAEEGAFIEPNWINFCLLGLGFLAHRSLKDYGQALEEAAKGAAAILVQFPLYFGIMALLRDGGLILGLSAFFSAHSSALSFPLYTFFSAGLVNIFVPSGGGQWAIQGPVILETAQQLGLPLGKAVMAMAYGDQITNMLQPFWALPLLAITGLKAREILAYSSLLLLWGSLVFLTVLLVF